MHQVLADSNCHSLESCCHNCVLKLADPTPKLVGLFTQGTKRTLPRESLLLNSPQHSHIDPRVLASPEKPSLARDHIHHVFDSPRAPRDFYQMRPTHGPTQNYKFTKDEVHVCVRACV